MSMFAPLGVCYHPSMSLGESLVVFACSGEGAGAIIRENIVIGYLCAAVGGVITLALGFDAWRTGRWRFALPAAALMLLMHPAWSVSAVHGDCGFFKRDASYFFTAVYSGLMIYQCFLAAWPKPRPDQGDLSS
jgi:hypothetical protein